MLSFSLTFKPLELAYFWNLKLDYIIHAKHIWEHTRTFEQDIRALHLLEITIIRQQQFTTCETRFD